MKYCKNSTISEAWFLLRGNAEKYDDDEVGAVITNAKKKFPDLERSPSIILVPKTDNPISPFWTAHLNWDKGNYQARLGHRYLSIHATCGSRFKYENYQSTMKSVINDWLKIYSGQVRDPESFKVESLGFGYVNTFSYPAKGFDLSKHFRLNLGIEVEGFNGAVSGLSSTFNYLDESTGVNVLISIELLPLPDDKNLQVKTKVVSEKRGISNTGVSELSKISEATENLKETSKRIFFGFTTETTRSAMGVVYA